MLCLSEKHRMERLALLCFLLLVSIFTFSDASSVGVNYGRIANNLPLLQSNPNPGHGEEMEQDGPVPGFKEFGLADLRAATNGFNSELIVSESGEKAPNVVSE